MRLVGLPRAPGIVRSLGLRKAPTQNLRLDTGGPGPRNTNFRLLVYAAPSSGSSLFAYFLAQIHNSLAIVDFFAPESIPTFDTDLQIVVKATIRTDVSFADHCASFRPTTKILFLRNPVSICASLTQKDHANRNGTVEIKLAILEECFISRDTRFDLTLRYEDFVVNPRGVIDILRRHAIAVPDDALSFRRSREEIADFNCRNSQWCLNGYVNGHWGFGNIHFDKLNVLQQIKQPGDPRIEDVVASLCPSLYSFYADQCRFTQ